MPHWLIKCAVQRAIGALPHSQKWNGLFQQYVTGTLELNSGRFEGRLGFCRQHLDYYFGHRPNEALGNVVDLGTGWYPAVPIGFFLCGAAAVYTFDIDPLLSRDRLERLIRMFVSYHERGALRALLPRLQPERVDRLEKLARQASSTEPPALLAQLGIHAFVRDARNTGIEAGSIDLCTSTGVLEYIPREILKGILAEFLRISRPQGLHIHYINLVDQYSAFDKAITPFNYLKYSSAAWKRLNSPLTWQSRLRIPDYREVFAECGYSLRKEVNMSGAETDLAKVRLASEFERYSREDLLVLYSWLVAESVGRQIGAGSR